MAVPNLYDVRAEGKDRILVRVCRYRDDWNPGLEIGMTPESALNLAAHIVALADPDCLGADSKFRKILEEVARARQAADDEATRQGVYRVL